jgi:hypothetical protein
MKTKSVLLFVFSVYLLSTSTLYSQNNRITPFDRDFPSSYKTPQLIQGNNPSKYFHDSIENLQLSPSYFSSEDLLIDSMIITYSGPIEKYKYTYNNNHAYSETLIEILKNGGWVNFAKSTSLHNENGVSTVLLWEEWDGSKWIILNRIIVERNSDNRIIFLSNQIWDGNQWIGNFQITTTYDTYGNEVSSISENWTDGEWTYDKKSTYDYNSKNRLIEHLYQDWNGNDWANDFRESSSYDSQNNLLIFVTETWNENQWVNATRDTNAYDSNNNITLKLNQYWNVSQWENIRRDIYEYSLERDTVTFSQENWSGDQWMIRLRTKQIFNSAGKIISSFSEVPKIDSEKLENSGFVAYDYDLKNKLLSVTGYDWNNDQWEDWWQYIYEYNDSGDLTHALSRVLENGNWVLSEAPLTYNLGLDYSVYYAYIWAAEIFVYYNPKTDVSSLLLESKFSMSQNFPNPFNPTTKIEYNLPASNTGFQQRTSLIVLDILGNEVRILVNENQAPGKHKIEFDASSLASGVYFYRLRSGNLTNTKKMLLLK